MRNSVGVSPAFEQAVYGVVASIPKGKVVTYGQIAEMAGMPGAAQEVGHIMSRVKAERNLPCHRVVNKAGEMSPDFAFGGQERQRAMLEEEDILFTSEGRIDMVRHQWREHEQMTF